MDYLEHYLKKFFPKQKINLQFKLSFITIAMLLATLIITMLASITSISSQATHDIKQYRQENITKTKQILKNYIDMAYALMDSTYQNAHNKAYLEDYYGHRLKNVIDMAEGIIRNKMGKVASGQMSLYWAKEEAKKEIKQLRYDGGTGYIWINDTSQPFPKMVMHPTVPTLDGKLLDSKKYNCALGIKKNLFVAFNDVCRKQGEGFVDYLWPKPTKDGLTKDQPKLSYVRMQKEWNWIIGTGIYIDDAVEEAKEKIKGEIKKLRYDKGTGYIWINDTGRPIPKMVMHPTVPALDGKVLDDPKFNCALGIKKNLFVAFVDACEKAGEGFVDYLWPKPTKDGLTEDQPKLSYARVYKPLNWIVGTGVYIDDIDVIVAAKTKTILKNQGWLIIKILVPAVLICIVAVFALLFFVKNVLQTVQSLVVKLKDIAAGEGDLTKRVDVISEDEMGELAQWFNVFLDKLSDMIGQFQGASAEIDGSSHELAGMGKGLIQSSDSLDLKVSNLKQSINELNDSMTTTSAVTEQSSANIANVDMAVKEFTQTINNISDNAAKSNSIASDAVEVVDNASKKISELIAKTGEINSIVNAISEISDQTKLLALNASIEAARAGDAGRGFSVVADEVKNLAGEVNKAAVNIRAILNNMKLATNESIQEIEKINKVIKDVNDSVTDIAAAVQEQTATTMGISNNITEASDGLQNVNENVAGVLGLSNQISQATNEVNEESQKVMEEGSNLHDRSTNMLSLSEGLQKLIAKFQIIKK